MGIRFYTGNAEGTIWTLEKEWVDDKTYPAITRDDGGKFHILYVDSVTKILGTINSEDGITWSAIKTIDIEIDVGDAGITYNKDIGIDGRLIAVYWKSSLRKYAYSDDRGINWIIGDVD